MPGESAQDFADRMMEAFDNADPTPADVLPVPPIVVPPIPDNAPAFTVSHMQML